MNLGYTIIYVENVLEAIEFYETAFDMKRGFIHEAGDYGELATGETRLAFTSHSLANSAVPVEYQGLDKSQIVAGFELTLTTPDVGNGYIKAVGAGAEPLAEPHDTSWGQTVSYVKDPFGVLISISSPISANS